MACAKIAPTLANNMFWARQDCFKMETIVTLLWAQRRTVCTQTFTLTLTKRDQRDPEPEVAEEVLSCVRFIRSRPEVDLVFLFLVNHRSTVTCEPGTLEETCGHSYWFTTNCVTAHYHNANWVLTANILPIRLAPSKFSFDHSICQPSLEKKNDCSCSGDFGRFSWTHMLTHQSLIVNTNRFCVIKVACIEFLHNTWTSHFNLFDLLFDNVSLDCRLFQSTSHCTFIVAKI